MFEEIKLERILEKGDELLVMDDKLKGTYYVLEGQFLVNSYINMDYINTGIMAQGDFIEPIGISPGTFYSANTYTAMMRSRVAFIPKDTFNILSYQKQRILYNKILESEMRRKAYLKNRIYSSDVRITQRMREELDYCLERGIKLKNFSDLAELLNTKPETITRNIKPFKKIRKYADVFLATSTRNKFLS